MSDTPKPPESLKVCPFCGGRPSLRSGISIDWYVCDGCGVQTQDFEGITAARAAWNRRTGERDDDVVAVTVEWLESVGFELDHKGETYMHFRCGLLSFAISPQDGMEWFYGELALGVDIPAPQTRGSVRTLAACLGVALQDSKL